MRYISIVLSFFSLFTLNCLGQDIINFPENLSFYTRNESNQCQVSIEVPNGILSDLRLDVKKDGEPLRSSIQLSRSTVRTRFNTVLSAGLSAYTFQLFSGDSLVKKAEKVLCGDAILLYGQSNALAIAGLDSYEQSYDDRWVRNYTLSSIYAEQGWHYAKDPFAQTGVLALALAAHFVEKDQIPIALINGAVGGQNIKQLSERNPTNPHDRETLYGRFLSRVDSASTLKNIKAMIWVQGEAETTAGEAAMRSYAQDFDLLYQNIKTDFPPIDCFIVLQNTLMAEGIGEAGIIRNAQSDFMNTYSDVTTLATVGQTDAFDGVHYGKDGYERLAWLLYTNLKNPALRSPKLRGIIKDLGLGYLRLVFDEDFEMELSRVRNLWYKQRVIDSFLFINGLNYQLKAVKTRQNEVWLRVNNLKDVESVTYLPSYFSDEFTRHYDGPAMKESNGFSALTFYDAKITEVRDQKTKRVLPLIGFMTVFDEFKKRLQANLKRRER